MNGTTGTSVKTKRPQSQICSICPRGKSPSRQPIQSTGALPCKLLIIDEAPQYQDNRWRKPYAGSVGKELHYQYLLRAGIPHSDIAITHAVCCSMIGHRTPSHEEARACADHNLSAQLTAYNPDVIALMGGVACSLASPKVNLELQHGIPFVGRLYNWYGPILPLARPAAGLHISAVMVELQQDFPVLYKMLYNRLESHPIADMIEQDYKVIGSRRELIADFRNKANGRDVGSIAIDTEVDCRSFELNATTDPPWMLSYSIGPGHGRIIRVQTPSVLAEFNDYVREVRPEVIMHNSLFDVPVCKRMGVDVPWGRVHDTMESAYIAGYLPKGLKAIGYRLLGIRMNDYMDLVTEPSQTKQAVYLSKLARVKGIKQPWLGKRQWSITRKANHAFQAWADKGAILQDRWKAWAKDQERDVWAAEDAVGPFPYRSIVHADQDLAAMYACQDADVTRRAKGALMRKLGRMRRMRL